jgi:hypothetical protein
VHDSGAQAHSPLMTLGASAAPQRHLLLLHETGAPTCGQKGAKQQAAPRLLQSVTGQVNMHKHGHKQLHMHMHMHMHTYTSPVGFPRPCVHL